MAIFGLSVSVVQRSSGMSATAAAAYRAADRIEDARSGIVHDYRRKTGVISSRIVLPDGCPPMGRSTLWNTAEIAEKRKDSGVAREFLLLLPHELSDEARERLALQFTRHLVARHGVAAECSIHLPSRRGDQRNHHAHILTTMREVQANGRLGARVAVLSSQATGSKEVTNLRAIWEAMLKTELAAHGISSDVSSLSLKVQKSLLAASLSGEHSSAARLERKLKIAQLERPPEAKIGLRSFRLSRAKSSPTDVNYCQNLEQVQSVRLFRDALDAVAVASRDVRNAENALRRSQLVDRAQQPYFVAELVERGRRMFVRLFAGGHLVSETEIWGWISAVNKRLGRAIGMQFSREMSLRIAAELRRTTTDICKANAPKSYPTTLPLDSGTQGILASPKRRNACSRGHER